jgi:hypothetical protein
MGDEIALWSMTWKILSDLSLQPVAQMGGGPFCLSRPSEDGQGDLLIMVKIGLALAHHVSAPFFCRS